VCSSADETTDHHHIALRIDELEVQQLAFLYDCAAAPQLAMLFVDAQGARHVTSFVLRERALVRAELRLIDAPLGACRIAAVPAPIGGLLLAASQCLVHVSTAARETDATVILFAVADRQDWSSQHTGCHAGQRCVNAGTIGH
jgi:hypothetical protein